MAILCLADGMDDLKERLGRILVGRTFAAGRCSPEIWERPTRWPPCSPRPEAELGSDAGGAARVHPRRSLRQHRPREQFGPGYETGAESRRLRSHGGRIRGGPGGRKVFRHRPRLQRPRSRRGGAGGHGAGPAHARGCAAVAAGVPDVHAVQAGLANLEHHVRLLKHFGLPVVVAVNRFDGDTDVELAAVAERCDALGAPCAVASVVQDGGAGGEELAHTVLKVLEETERATKMMRLASGRRTTGDCLSRRNWKFSPRTCTARTASCSRPGQAGHQSVRGAGRRGFARLRRENAAFHFGSARFKGRAQRMDADGALHSAQRGRGLSRLFDR